jgi:hypothetical protein
VVFEQDQVLSKHTNRFHGTLQHPWVELGVEFVDQSHRLPIKSEQFSTGTLRPHLGQELILIGFHGFKLPLGNVSKQRVDGHDFHIKALLLCSFLLSNPSCQLCGKFVFSF